MALAIAFASALGFAGPASAAKLPSFDFGEPGTLGGQFGAARGIAVNEEGVGGVPAGTIYVIEFANNRIQSFAPDDNGTPADPKDDSYDFLRAWGWDVDAVNPSTEFEICEVAADCQAGVSGSGGAGQFDTLAGGIAVDQATGHVYTIDRGNYRVQEFDPVGSFVRTWGKDVDSTGGTGFEVCEVAANCQAGEAGGAAGEFAFGATLAIAGIGTDSSGNLYVADAGNARAQKFDSEGGFLRAAGWDVVESGPGDTLGNEYEICVPAEGDTCKSGTTGTGVGQYGSNNLPSFLAASTCGDDVYATGRVDGTVYHLNGDLGLIEEYAETAGTNNNRNAVAVSCPDGHLFFTERVTTKIKELDPETGEVVAEHEAPGDQWVGLAIDSTTGRMLGTRTTSATEVHVWEEVANPPIVEILPPAANTGTRATLAGTVDPNEVALEECLFEWGTTTGYGNTAPCVPGPAGVGEGNEPVEVQAEISGLAPNGTTYHYRLFAKNENTEDGIRSNDEAFETPDTVITLPASEVGPTAATLGGTVNPDSEEIVDCLFEWGETTGYGSTAPCVPAPAGIGTGEAPVAVEAELEGLVPGTDYHFRLTAQYASGETAQGGDESFLTPGPTILATWAEDVGAGDASLHAEIDPKGSATTYRFEYATQAAFDAAGFEGAFATSEVAVGSDESAHEVSQVVEGLAPGTIYRYRVVATSSVAVNEGPDHSFTTYALPLHNTDCPNQSFRVEPSASLPDCRAYEMVSPLDKGGSDIVARQGVAVGLAAYRQAALGGERLTYTSSTAFGDARRAGLSNQYLATRGGEGWSSHGLNPPLGTTVFDPDSGFNYDLGTPFQAFTPDLCTALMIDHNLKSMGAGLPLLPEAIQGFTNLYLRDNCGPGADVYEAMTTGAPPPLADEGVDLELHGRNYSRDLRHVVFTASAELESTPPPDPFDEGREQVYDYDRLEGELRLVSVLPGGEAASPADNTLGSGDPRRDASLARAVSEDGSRVFWTASPGAEGSKPGSVYLRVNPGEAQSALDAGGECTEPSKACTIPIVEPEGNKGKGWFWSADPQGSTAIVSAGDGLQGTDDMVLYELDVDRAIAEGAATALSPIAGRAGGLVGASEDLGTLYFTSEEDLDGPGPAQENEWNLYVRRAGEASLIESVSLQDRRNVDSLDRLEPRFHTSRVSADGRRLLFTSNRSLTGYDNADAASGEAAREVFLYDAEEDELTCLSCNPSGARPEAQMRGSLLSAAWVPAWEWPNYAKRSLVAGGQRVFFNSFDALLPSDVNGVQDVYQWEEPGTGDCDASDANYFASNGGCISLISTGRSPTGSELLDASGDGGDVFFTTESSIDPRDPGLIDIYDAREGGGFPPPEPSRTACVGDACQPVPAPPAAHSPASALLRGPGDPLPGADCRAPAQRAKRLAGLAKRLRRAARRAKSGAVARRRRARARGAARRARRLSKRAKRCRARRSREARTSGRAGR